MPLPLSPAGRRYGYLRDLPDPRDFKYKATIFRSALTDSPVGVFDTEPWAGPVFDQGAEGSCTANAGCGYRELLIRKFPEYEHGLVFGEDPSSIILSRAYLYYGSRLFDGNPTDDVGSYGRSVCRVLNGNFQDVNQVNGVCLDSEMPYQTGVFSVAPTLDQVAAAQRWRAGSYHRIVSKADAIACLASGYPIMLGFTVYESFESDDLANTGIMRDPAPNEGILGGHETLILGANTTTQDVGKWPAGFGKVRNSWGVGWGDSGDYYMHLDLLDNPDFTEDMWMFHLGHKWA